MKTSIDFSTPIWLVNYYHVIGTVSMVLNSYALFLVLFKSSKLDSFKYYLLAYQLANQTVDIHITFLMQPLPLHPIPAGFCTGFLAQNNFVPCHYLLVMICGLIGIQASSLALCFFRKFISIKKIERVEVSLWPRVVVAVTMPLFVILLVTMFSLGRESDYEEFEIIHRDYPEYEQSFKGLDNFALYELDGYWILVVVDVVVSYLWLGSVILYSTKRIYEILGKFKSNMSTGTYRRHRQATMSLIAQLLTSLIAVIPPLSLCALFIFKFEHEQVISRMCLMIFSTHTSVNAIVLVVTTPSFREYTKFWKKRKGTPVVVSTAPSGMF